MLHQTPAQVEDIIITVMAVWEGGRQAADKLTPDQETLCDLSGPDTLLTRICWEL